MRDAARSIFMEALREASIAKGFSRHVNCERGILRVREDLYDLNAYSRVLVMALGKDSSLVRGRTQSRHL